jgi:hypothetical protein
MFVTITLPPVMLVSYEHLIVASECSGNAVE